MRALLREISWKNLVSDIRFWLFVFFVLRLYHINAPIFDSHAWRQADGYAIARNFFEIDNNIFYPRINHAGARTGIMGSEFPLMNYLVYLTYLIFDVDWWQGRLLNLIVSTFGIWYFYRLIHKFFSKEAAFPAALILLTSIWLVHSRKFMPDVFSTSLVIIGVYYGWSYFKENSHRWRNLVLFVLFCSFGLMSKLPSFVAGAFLLPAFIDSEVSLKKKIIVIGTGIIILSPVIYWYFVWAPYLTDTYGFYYFFMGATLSEGLHYLTTDWQGTLSRFYFDALHFIGFGAFVIGTFFVFKKKEMRIVHFFAASLILLVVYMLKGGETFAHHTYYIIPVVPMLAFVAAYGISNIRKMSFQYILLTLIMVEGVGDELYEFRIKPEDMYKLRMESIADSYTNKDDLIAINNGANPTAMYFAHRKGWLFDSSINGDDEHFELYRWKKCKLIIWDKHNGEPPSNILGFKKIKSDQDFVLYLPE